MWGGSSVVVIAAEDEVVFVICVTAAVAACLLCVDVSLHSVLCVQNNSIVKRMKVELKIDCCL